VQAQSSEIKKLAYYGEEEEEADEEEAGCEAVDVAMKTTSHPND